MQASGQPVPISWLKSPDSANRAAVTEYTRGILCSLANSHYGDLAESRPIHTSKIRAQFEGLGAPELYRLGLGLLQLLREVEQLHSGFWLLTPYRIVSIGRVHAFIGAVPIVSRALENVEQRGLGRFVPEAVAARLPRQSLQSWMGETPDTTNSVLNQFLANHRKLAAPTCPPPQVEYLKILGDRGDSRFGWIQEPNQVLPSERIGICRERRGTTYRYFSAEIAHSQIQLESPIENKPLRVMFALAGNSGRPVNANVRIDGGHLAIHVPEPLPREEYRLATLLADTVLRSGRGSTYVVDRAFADVFLTHLNKLGCRTGTLT